MKSVEFFIRSQPVPASRPRVTPRGVFYPKAHTAYKEYLRKVLPEFPSFKTDKLCQVRLLFVMPPYKTSSYPTHRADLDNLAKLPLDCMTDSERYWEDDSLVALLTCSKRFCLEDEEPHTKVFVSELEKLEKDTLVQTWLT